MKFIVMMLLLFPLCFSSMIQAQNGVEVIINHELLEEQFRSAIRNEVGGGKKISVSLSRKTSQILHIKAVVEKENFGPNLYKVTLKLDIQPTCSGDRVRINIKDWDVDAKALAIPVPGFIHGPFTDGIINQKLIDEINEVIADETTSLDSCPRFKILSGGDLSMYFGEGDECSSGERRVEQCRANFIGTGIHSKCEEGFWKFIENDCQFCGFGNPSCHLN